MVHRQSNNRITAVVCVTIVFLILLVSCSSSIGRRIKQNRVNDFYNEAISAAVKYGEEPVPGEPRPFPASFVITGKLLMSTAILPPVHPLPAETSA